MLSRLSLILPFAALIFAALTSAGENNGCVYTGEVDDTSFTGILDCYIFPNSNQQVYIGDCPADLVSIGDATPDKWLVPAQFRFQMDASSSCDCIVVVGTKYYSQTCTATYREAGQPNVLLGNLIFLWDPRFSMGIIAPIEAGIDLDPCLVNPEAEDCIARLGVTLTSVTEDFARPRDPTHLFDHQDFAYLKLETEIQGRGTLLLHGAKVCDGTDPDTAYRCDELRLVNQNPFSVFENLVTHVVTILTLKAPWSGNGYLIVDGGLNKTNDSRRLFGVDQPNYQPPDQNWTEVVPLPMLVRPSATNSSPSDPLAPDTSDTSETLLIALAALCFVGFGMSAGLLVRKGGASCLTSSATAKV